MNNNDIQVVPNPPNKKRINSLYYFFIYAMIPLLIIGPILDSPLWAYLILMLLPILAAYALFLEEMNRRPILVRFDENGITLQYKRKDKVCPWNSIQKILLFDGETKYQGQKRKDAILFIAGEDITTFLTYELGLLVIERYRSATGRELEHGLWGEL